MKAVMDAMMEGPVMEQQVNSWQVNSWQGVHEQLVRLAERRAAHELEEARWLLAGLRAEVHRHVGMGSYNEYLERLFGYRPREVAERLRVARALEQLPETAAALASGALCYSAARELTRVATKTTEAQWLSAAEGQTVRQVEAMVSGRRSGDTPSDPADDSAKRHILRFEVSADTYALWREAEAAIRQQAGEPIELDDVLLLMARQILGGPASEERSPYQVALTICERCSKGWQDGRGEVVPVDDVVVEMAACDCQHIGQIGHIALTHGTHVGNKPASQNIPPATRRQVLRRDHGRCVVDGCRHAMWLDVHHLHPQSEGGSHHAANLATLCASHHRAAHHGRLIIDGNAEHGFTFFHADGSRYGSPAPAAAIDASAQAFGALCHLGFKETAARQALRQVATHVGASVEELVRGALAVLT